ncbi:MAG: hypothetical protein AAGA02_05650 [Bacteroidota bacterium]
MCSFYSSGQEFAYGFLQIPSRDGHPCLQLTLPTVKRVRDLHPIVSYCPCRAHIKKAIRSFADGPFL